MTLDELLTALPSLSFEELEQVQKTTESLLSLSKKPSQEENSDWLLAGILEVIQAKGLSYTVPEFFKIKKDTAHGGFLPKSRKIRTFLETELKNSSNKIPKRVDLYTFGHRCAGMLYDYLEPSHEMSLDSMLRNVEKLPLAIEASFPGYLAAGLLRMLLKRSTPWVD
jgi:hypothetical protein